MRGVARVYNMKDLYDKMRVRLGIEPFTDPGRIDNIEQFWFRAMFCKLCREQGLDAFTIGEMIGRDFATVNKSIRDMKSLEGKTDFISKAILREYDYIKLELNLELW